MKRSFSRSFYLLISFFGAGLLLAGLPVAKSIERTTPYTFNESAEDPVDPELKKRMVDATDDELIEYLVYIHYRQEALLSDLPEAKSGRKAAVVDRLKEAAKASQAKLIRQLKLLEAARSVNSWRTIWIANAIKISGNRESISVLAGNPEIERITLDERLRLIEPKSMTPSILVTPTWGVETIRAPHAWQALGVTGEGATVAVMDTGVDWLHPALRANYRGNSSGGIHHQENWFDAVDGTVEPFDPNGHGTHVAGTAVGRQGIGVAPDAQWIGVRVLDSDGFARISDLHFGFEWLLAPGGDPGLSPDVVNGSWGGNSSLTDLVPDVQALLAAGIVPVFSAGNAGPAPGTVNAPASYPGTIAVGASDELDHLAWFSSRGPSPSTNEYKPTVVAPGTYVLSTLPGSKYGYLDGTSMSAPHVAGAYALLLSAFPSYSVEKIEEFITSSAQAISDSSPDMSSGWGRIDVYSALSRSGPWGTLSGIVTVEHMPIANMTLTMTTPAGVEIPLLTDGQGRYSARLLPGNYQLQVDSFGLYPYQVDNLTVIDGETTHHSIDLAPQPRGLLTGIVRDETAGLPVSGSVLIQPGKIQQELDRQGRFSVMLPVGDYHLRTHTTGNWIVTRDVSISFNSTTRVNLTTSPSPKAMLVDTGRWYYRSQIDFFAEALIQNNLAFDRWTISNPYTDLPTFETLSPYDMIFWSAPLDSPSAVGADSALFEYLDDGGQLFISGQRIGALEDQLVFGRAWWDRQLNARFLKAGSPSTLFIGESSTNFADLEFFLNGADSARNQTTTDRVEPRPGAFTSVTFSDQFGESAGLAAGLCEPFKIVYLGLGLEGVSPRTTRSEIVRRSLEYFDTPPTVAGMIIRANTVDALIAPRMKQEFKAELSNVSETLTDTFSLRLEGNQWDVSLVSSDLTLGPCSSDEISFTVTAPASALPDEVEQFRLIAQSDNHPEVQEVISVSLKVAGHVLLVDDDRWYDQELTFRAALAGAGVEFDFWDTARNQVGQGGPPRALLKAYDIVVWYTGYDWFAPITRKELESLDSYLQGGGSLFLTSQDFLYYHSDDAFTTDYLGLLDYSESVTPTAVFGGGGYGLTGELGGPVPLDFGPYLNNGDGLINREQAEISLWHDRGMPAGVAHRGSGWRTIFWGIPFETLPIDRHSDVMEMIVGWLTDLGDSTFEASQRTFPYPLSPSELFTYTAVLTNSNPTVDSFVVVTNTLPHELKIRRSSLTDEATLDMKRSQVLWRGIIPAGSSQEISYLAYLDPKTPPGSRVDNRLDIYYPSLDIQFHRTASIWLETPDLTSSKFTASPDRIHSDQLISYQLVLSNSGTVAGPFVATLNLAKSVEILSGTIVTEIGDIKVNEDAIIWTGEIGANQTVSLSFKARFVGGSRPKWVLSNVVIEDGVTEPLILATRFAAEPYEMYLPLIYERR